MSLLFNRINILSNTSYYYFRRKIRKKNKKVYSFDSKASMRFENIIKSIPAEKVFLHIALSTIKHFSPEKNQYKYLFNILKDNFEAITTNGFTPKVKKTTHFNPVNEPPVYGAFAKLFFNDCTFRNHDPLYSVIGYGAVDFDKKEMSFVKNGLFKKMINNEYYGLNIDGGNITSSMLHMIELELQVPYIKTFYNHYTIDVDGEELKIKYLDYYYINKFSLNGYVRWNREKIIQDLLKAKIISIYNFDGLGIYYFKYEHFYDLILKKVRNNPFYLITW